MGGPPVLHPPMQASTSAVRRNSPPASRSKKPQPSVQYPSTSLGSDRPQLGNRGPDLLLHSQPMGLQMLPIFCPLIGRKVWTPWPEDNSFYEAHITDYKPEDVCLTLDYAVVCYILFRCYYSCFTKLFPVDRVRMLWYMTCTLLMKYGNGSVLKRYLLETLGGRVMILPSPAKVAALDLGRKRSPCRVVAKVFGSNFPDPVEIRESKGSAQRKMFYSNPSFLANHEQALVDAISRLEDASDGESDRGRTQVSRGRSMDQERSRKQAYDESHGLEGHKEGQGG